MFARAPSFQPERTPSEWERAFLAEEAVVLRGGAQDVAEEGFNRVGSFNVQRTPSEWEQAFTQEQVTAIEGDAARCEQPPGLIDTYANLSPEEVEKQFMAQMAEAMGGSADAKGVAPNSAGTKSLSSGHFLSPRSDSSPSKTPRHLTSGGSVHSTVSIWSCVALWRYSHRALPRREQLIQLCTVWLHVALAWCSDRVLSPTMRAVQSTPRCLVLLLSRVLLVCGACRVQPSTVAQSTPGARSKRRGVSPGADAPELPRAHWSGPELCVCSRFTSFDRHIFVDIYYQM